MASVRMRWGRRLLVLPLGLALLASACASTPEPNPHSPDVRLAALLDAWQQARRDDGGCQQRRPEETPLIDCERIRKQVERLAIEFPNHPDVLLANAVLAFESGKPDDAQKDLDVLRRLNPIQPKASVLRARIAIEDGNLRFAHRLLEEQMELAPADAGLRELAAVVHYLEGDEEAARRSLAHAERLGAPPWRVAYHRGLLAEAADRPVEAMRAYETCLALAPSFDAARARLRALVSLQEIR